MAGRDLPTSIEEGARVPVNLVGYDSPLVVVIPFAAPATQAQLPNGEKVSFARRPQARRSACARRSVDREQPRADDDDRALSGSAVQRGTAEGPSSGWRRADARPVRHRQAPAAACVQGAVAMPAANDLRRAMRRPARQPRPWASGRGSKRPGAEDEPGGEPKPAGSMRGRSKAQRCQQLAGRAGVLGMAPSRLAGTRYPATGQS